MRQRADHDAVEVVVNDVAGGLVVERVQGLVHAVHLVSLVTARLSAVTRVCEGGRRARR